MKYITKAAQKILEAKEIMVSCHINPDGDAIGSLLSLGLGLKLLGKNVYLVSQDGVPEKYRFLPGADSVKKSAKKNIDLAIAVDCSRGEMLGDVYNDFKKAGTVLEIDHHELRASFGDISIVNAQAVAVGELVYSLLKELEVSINHDIAKNILTSIIVETNSFRLPSVSSNTFEICSDLLGTGVEFFELVSKLFWSKTKQAALLTGLCLRRCEFLHNDRIVWTIVRRKDLNKYNGNDDDVDTVVDELRSIQGVEIGIFFREKNKDQLRVSMRAKGGINLAEIAAGYGGGGHHNAAGCQIPNNKREIRKFLIKIGVSL